MFQFWRKNGLKEHSQLYSSSTSKISNHQSTPLVDGNLKNDVDNPPVGPLSCFSDDEVDVGDPGDSDKICSVNNVLAHSRLSKTLSEVLADKSALGYFIQYMESKGCVALIKFWLDADCFCAASCAEVRASGDLSGIMVTREMLEGECASGAHSPHHEVNTDGSVCWITGTDDLSCGKSTNVSPKKEIAATINDCNLAQLTRKNIESYESHTFGVSGSDVEHSGMLNSHIQPGLKDNSKILASGNTSKSDDTDVSSNSDFTAVVTLYSVDSGSETVAKQFFEPVSPTCQTASPTRAVKLIQATLNDAVRIFRKYFVHNAPYRIRIPEDARNRMISAICKESGIAEVNCFSECQNLVFHIMEKEFFNEFLRSDYHCKHQIDVLTSGNVMLADILYNDTALFYFMEFMEQEGNQSLLEFWLAAVNFQQHLLEKKGLYNADEAQNDAIILYDKYFSLQATCPLGFNDKIRFEIEQNICREGGPLPDCFSKPARMVLHVLEKNYLQPFLTSQLFFKYLSELINTIQSGSSFFTRSRKSGSECSSELSLSVHNTLLASEDATSVPRRIICNVDDRQMSIDSRQLYDPDSLWKRRKHRDLSFGRITGLGRYESDVEPEPDRKEGSRLTRVVKKLVNLEEDKAKEELAWQIAEMIVKDVMNLTSDSDSVNL